MGNAWKETLDGGDVLLIDGGMGTELQRRGVAMNLETWSGTAARLHADTVQKVHEDYIRAGAQVIITNTFGSNRMMLEAAGLGDEVVQINQQAVQSALRARNTSRHCAMRFLNDPGRFGEILIQTWMGHGGQDNLCHSR